MTTASPANTEEGLRTSEYLAFRLGREEYALPIEKVGEIRGYDAVTRIANAPEHLKGVINLRGTIVPIIDLRIKFGISEPTYDQFTVVIILMIAGRTVGIVVDGVSDVISMSDAQIKDPPELGTAVDSAYLVGVASLESRLLILVDVAELVGADTLTGHERLAA